MRGSTERLLYQCFPRSLGAERADYNLQCRSGLAILQFLMTYGLLLTPEPKRIEPHPASQLHEPQATEIIQIRSSFTAMPRSEIFIENGQGFTHNQKYGPFIVGLASDAALRLGMIPTFYVPVQHRERKRGEQFRVTAGELGNDILCNLADLRHLLIAVAEIEARARRDDSIDLQRLRKKGLTLPKGDRAASALQSSDFDSASAAFTLVDTDRPPAFVLAEFVEILLSNYQQVTQSDEHSLTSYDEREWRIINTTSEGLDCYRFEQDAQQFHPPIIRALLDHARIATSDTARELGNHERINLENCALLVGANGRRFFDYVQEVIVPAKWADIVGKLLATNGGRPFSLTAADDAPGHAVFVRPS